jgi:RNA polymerase sigma factor (sigma-70 family)
MEDRGATSGPTATSWLVGARERAALFNDLTPLVRQLLAHYAGEPWLVQRLRAAIYDQFCTLVAGYDERREPSIRAYLVRTLPDAVHTHARQQARLMEQAAGIADDSKDPGAPLRNPAGEYLRSLELRAALRALPGLIAHLPLRQRQVVIGRFYEGRSLEEMAAGLELSGEAVRSLLHEAIEGLRTGSGGPRRRE